MLHLGRTVPPTPSSARQESRRRFSALNFQRKGGKFSKTRATSNAHASTSGDSTEIGGECAQPLASNLLTSSRRLALVAGATVVISGSRYQAFAESIPLAACCMRAGNLPGMRYASYTAVPARVTLEAQRLQSCVKRYRYVLMLFYKRTT